MRESLALVRAKWPDQLGGLLRGPIWGPVPQLQSLFLQQGMGGGLGEQRAGRAGGTSSVSVLPGF